MSPPRGTWRCAAAERRTPQGGVRAPTCGAARKSPENTAARRSALQTHRSWESEGLGQTRENPYDGSCTGRVSDCSLQVFSSIVSIFPSSLLFPELSTWFKAKRT